MDHFFIITNLEKDQEMEMTKKIVNHLQENHKTCYVRKKVGCVANGHPYATDPATIPPETQCVIVLGGDGTLLQAARDIVSLQIPLIGINMGTLGYLAGVDKQSVTSALDLLMRDEFELEERMMLTGKVYRGEEIIACGIALNDIVISRDGPLRVVKFINYVNGEYLNSYNADGVIIATPTGSTGYSLSAGGPIVAPNAKMKILTPLAAHELNSRSIVIPAADPVMVEIGEGRHRQSELGIAVFDGDMTVSMVTGDRILIEQADVNTQIIKLNSLSFVEVLRQKMGNM
ncbi:MAG: NAD(+)/NADH kinase [Lachnospiraceae bacterium]